jgi:hypothetical protein
MNPRTVGKHVVNEPVVVIHTVFVVPPDPTCISHIFSRDLEEDARRTAGQSLVSGQCVLRGGRTGEDARPGDGEAVRIEAHPHHVVYVVLPSQNPNRSSKNRDQFARIVIINRFHISSITDHVAVVLVDGHVGGCVVRSSTYDDTRTHIQKPVHKTSTISCLI